MSPTTTQSDVSTVERLRQGALEVAVPATVWADRFDAVYREASGDRGKVPWSHRRPSPSMVNWMNAAAPGLLRPGARVAVVGCGLGEDAVFLADRGYEVSAFDVSPTAIEWAKRLHPQHDDLFSVADLLDLPGSLRHRFDLVVEVHTLQALPPKHRVELARGMAELLVHGGVLLACARGRSDEIPLEAVSGPPFAFSSNELDKTLRGAGLIPIEPVACFEDDNDPPVQRLRAVYRRCDR
jgi:SAM-dependent methyltransferase